MRIRRYSLKNKILVEFWVTAVALVFLCGGVGLLYSPTEEALAGFLVVLAYLFRSYQD